MHIFRATALAQLLTPYSPKIVVQPQIYSTTEKANKCATAPGRRDATALVQPLYFTASYLMAGSSGLKISPPSARPNCCRSPWLCRSLPFRFGLRLFRFSVVLSLFEQENQGDNQDGQRRVQKSEWHFRFRIHSRNNIPYGDGEWVFKNCVTVNLAAFWSSQLRNLRDIVRGNLGQW